MYWLIKNTRPAILLVIGLVLSFSPNLVSAATTSSSGDMQVSGTVADTPPSTPPTIEEPAPESTFTNKSITVKGSCVSGLIVKIYRNNIFAGSALCQANGTFSLNIDLFLGRNDLFAQQFNSSGQASPTSNKVTVYYVLPEAPSLPSGTPSTEAPGTSQSRQEPFESIAQFQLVIDYDYTLQSILVDQPFFLPIKFTGGEAPYAVSVDWGDGTTDVYSRETTKEFTIEHIYTEPGFYTVTISVSDKTNDKASLQFVLLVSGEEKPPFLNQIFFDDDYQKWQIIIGVALVLSWVVAFILGQRFSPTKKSKG